MPQVYDLAGSLLPIQAVSNTGGYVLDVSTLQTGLYNVILNYDEVRVVKRFVK